MKLEGTVKAADVKITRSPRTSKYDTIVHAIQQLKPGENVVVSLIDEEDPKSAAQRIAVAVRKCAEGKIDCKIKSRFDKKDSRLLLWESDLPLEKQAPVEGGKKRGRKSKKDKEKDANVAAA